MYRDEDDEDDVLAQADVRLEPPSGGVERLALRGCGGFPDCSASFQYEVAPHLPPPPVHITLKGFRVADVEAVGPPLLSHTRPRDGVTTGVHLRFCLLEAGEPPPVVASPPAVPSETTASTVRWDDISWPDLERGTIKLTLPRGAPRPPTVRIELWDAELKEEHNPLAVGEVKLGGTDGGRVAPSGSRKVAAAAGKQYTHTHTHTHTTT